MTQSGEELAWDAYFIPGTQVLKNRLGIHDFDQLQEAERFLVTRRTELLHAGYADIPRSFDADHIKAIHRYLFSDVYEFAGTWRNVHIGKRTVEGEPSRWFLPPNGLDTWFTDLSETVRSTPWKQLDRPELVKQLAEVHTYVNFAHGFREGSGRSARVYLEHVVEGTPFALDFTRIDPDSWNAAARDSIAPGRVRPAAGPLIFEPQVAVFDAIVVNRPQAAVAHAAGESVRLASLDYPSGPYRGAQRPAAPYKAPAGIARPSTQLER